MMNKEIFFGLRTVIYKVDDLSKAKKWYTKILGKAPYFEKSFYVGFNVGGYELGLLPLEEDIEKRSSNETVYWGVQDINQVYRRLLELGATAYEKPENVGEDIMTATVKDPWDNVFGIIYNPSFKTETK